MGDRGTGKSSLIYYYINGYFLETHKRIYSNYCFKKIDTPKGKITLYLLEYDREVPPINEMSYYQHLIIFLHIEKYF